MPESNDLPQLLWAAIEAFCIEHQCEVRLFAPLPPKLAELIGVTEAIIPATLLVVPLPNRQPPQTKEPPNGTLENPLPTPPYQPPKVMNLSASGSAENEPL